MRKTILRKKLLFLIVILGLILRILLIDSAPPSLYGDELTIALDAQSLLKTGRDQLGNFLPLTFSMGAGRPAGYVYGSIPFVALFGPTALGVRTLSIISGLAIIILLYLLGRRVLGEKTGLCAAAIGAISPWDISLSRGGFEAHLALLLALLGTYLFLRASEKPMFYILSALSFGLTLHTYPTYKVSLLLFFPLLFWYQGGRKILMNGKKYFLSGVLVLFFLGILSFSQTFIGGSEVRFFNINIFSQKELKSFIEQKINFERQISKLPKTVRKYFHNKPVEYTNVFIDNYLKNFSLDFLILQGDGNPRHNMATTGQIYTVEIFLIIIAILTFWQKEKRLILFLLLWILLAPVPTAIVDLPHALRSSFMMPPLIILSALGLVTILKFQSRIPLVLVSIFFFIQFVFFIQKLYFLAPNEYSNFWSYPAKFASEIALENREKYDFIILSDKIESVEFAYPVYSKTDPNLIIDQNKNKNMFFGYRLKKYGNVFIGNIVDTGFEEAINNIPGSVLYIGSKYEGNSFVDYEIINGLDEQAALVVKKKH